MKSFKDVLFLNSQTRRIEVSGSGKRSLPRHTSWLDRDYPSNGRSFRSPLQNAGNLCRALYRMGFNNGFNSLCIALAWGSRFPCRFRNSGVCRYVRLPDLSAHKIAIVPHPSVRGRFRVPMQFHSIGVFPRHWISRCSEEIARTMQPFMQKWLPESFSNSCPPETPACNEAGEGRSPIVDRCASQSPIGVNGSIVPDNMHRIVFTLRSKLI